MFNIYMYIYNVIIHIIQPIIWIQVLWRNKYTPLYQHHWLERYGIYPHTTTKSKNIVLHAVSLGEMLAVIPLIRALNKQYPEITIILTTMTSTGLHLAQTQFAQQNNIYYSYLPYDLPGSINRFIKKTNPKLVIVMETELWPNLINKLYSKNIPFIVINARLSLQSFTQYQKIKTFISVLMQRITLIVAQNKEDGDRFIQLGLQKRKLIVLNNLKFDISIPQKTLHQIAYLKKKWTKNRPIWIAGSTHAGEELLLLKVHKKLLNTFPNLLMILSPRNPERFIIVTKITYKAGFSYILHSSGHVPTANTQVIINDTIGELTCLYGLADIAFIGGSLIKHGGHNPLEPAAHAIPIIMGPHTFNFHNICAKLQENKGLITVTDKKSLIQIMSILIRHPEYRLNYGHNALKVLKHHQGTVKNLLSILKNFIHY